MTKDLAKRIAESLTMPMQSIELIADGHRLSAVVIRSHKSSLRFVVALYVDGYIRGVNMAMDNEIGAKFYPLRTRSCVSHAKMAAFRKACGKKAADAFKKRATFQYREATFRSGSALAAHLHKHCTSVEIADPFAPVVNA